MLKLFLALHFLRLHNIYLIVIRLKKMKEFIDSLFSLMIKLIAFHSSPAPSLIMAL